MTQIFEATTEYAQTAGESMELALQDLERIETLLRGESMRSALTAEERLEIIKKARELRDLAESLGIMVQGMENLAIY